MSGPADALARYESSTRRRTLIYYAIVTAIVLVFGTIFVVVVSTGEAADADLRTDSHPPATLSVSDPSPTLTRAWSTADHTAIGTPLWNGTVVTWSAHGVGGRDARTGKQTWLYTRSDYTVCTAAQVGGTTIAVYDRGGDCDEVSAFASDTGKRYWVRTLDEDGQPLQGHPTYQVGENTFMIITPAVIYSLDTGNSGIDRWTYSRYGCRIEHVVLGDSQTLISQDCSSKVRCTGVSFCGKGPQLFLRSDVARDDKTKKNFDKITWNDIGNTGVPVSADGLVSAAQPGSNVLDVLSAATGKQSGTVQLAPQPSTLSGISSSATTTADLVWVDGVVHLVQDDPARVSWTAPAVAASSVIDIEGDTVPLLSSARITVPTTSGIASLDPATGKVLATFPITPPGPGSVVSPLGTGFLVSSTTGTVAYR